MSKSLSENTTFKIGSLFSGYGGLDLAVEHIFNAQPAWFVEVDSAPSKILAHHWPNVTNLGDVSTIGWQDVPSIDILTGGSPCQDLSAAGKRAGMTPGTRSNLWVHMREAIAALTPKLVIWENVQGALSAKAKSDSDLESPNGQMGETNLRALGRVLGDLSEIGYDARWTTFRASDVGAPHRRARVFLVAYPSGLGLETRGLSFPITTEISSIDSCLSSLPPVKLLPTPSTMDHLPAREGEARERQLRRGNPNGSRRSSTGNLREDIVHVSFDKYEPAVRRWESIVGQAPAPTVCDAQGKLLLNTEFAEWMMGLPLGWVTSPEIGLTRPQQIKAIGNGVCPQQAAAAIYALINA